VAREFGGVLYSPLWGLGLGQIPNRHQKERSERTAICGLLIDEKKDSLVREKYRVGQKKVSQIIFAITLSTASQFP